MSHPITSALTILLMAFLTASCDRNVESYVAGEEPEQPDLSKIFPEGAEAEKPTSAGMPGSAGRPAPQRGAAPVASAASGDNIQGTVRVGEGLTAGDGVLFIIARSSQGGPPLAVKRIASPRFPMEFTLGPDDMMSAGMPFQGPLAVTVRLDGDGNAMSRTPGDLMGAASEPLEPGASGVVIVLDQAI